MNTKRINMKLKMTLCGLSLLSAPALVQCAPALDNVFINGIIVQVKNSFDEIDKLYDKMTKPSALTFDQCVKEAAAALEHMKTNVLKPLTETKGKSAVEQKAITLAHELVTEIHTLFGKVYKVLENHAKSPKKNNAVILAAPLQDVLKPLIAPDNLKKLKSKLHELLSHLEKIEATTAVSEIKEVIAHIEVAIKKSGEANSEMKAKILAALKDLLSRK